jgi:hypothetical protein
MSREAVPNSNHCIRAGTDRQMPLSGRPECAKTGHSPMVCKVGQVGAQLTVPAIRLGRERGKSSGGIGWVKMLIDKAPAPCRPMKGHLASLRATRRNGKLVTRGPERSFGADIRWRRQQWGPAHSLLYRQAQWRGRRSVRGVDAKHSRTFYMGSDAGRLGGPRLRGLWPGKSRQGNALIQPPDDRGESDSPARCELSQAGIRAV